MRRVIVSRKHGRATVVHRPLMPGNAGNLSEFPSHHYRHIFLEFVSKDAAQKSVGIIQGIFRLQVRWWLSAGVASSYCVPQPPQPSACLRGGPCDCAAVLELYTAKASCSAAGAVLVLEEWRPNTFPCALPYKYGRCGKPRAFVVALTDKQFVCLRVHRATLMCVRCRRLTVVNVD